MNKKRKMEVNEPSIIAMLLAKDPRIQWGMKTFIEMMKYQKWQRERFIKARKGKK